MAEILHCVCGRPIECARTDIIETIRCPHCNIELALDLPDESARRRGYLTVVEGPDRRGEVVLIPVGERLGIGSRLGNWLYLPDPSVAWLHCRVALQAGGELDVYGDESQPGVPATPTARLRSGQALRVGAFVLRFLIGPIQPVGPGGGALGQRPVIAPPADRGPVLQRVGDGGRRVARLARMRFGVARFAAVALTAAAAIINLARLSRADRLWTIESAVRMVPLIAVLFAARRIGLGRAGWNWGVVGVLVLAGAAQLFGAQPLLAVALGVAAGGISLLVPTRIGVAVVMCGVALLVMAAGLTILEPLGPWR
ncbi:MAG: FHA domain-containing protein [Phycisphaerae bacterium]